MSGGVYTIGSYNPKIAGAFNDYGTIVYWIRVAYNALEAEGLNQVAICSKLEGASCFIDTSNGSSSHTLSNKFRNQSCNGVVIILV